MPKTLALREGMSTAVVGAGLSTVKEVPCCT